jgi:hypothetical protein
MVRDLDQSDDRAGEEIWRMVHEGVQEVVRRLAEEGEAIVAEENHQGRKGTQTFERGETVG